MKTGKLIVLEGTDGSGKGTQFQFLLKRLKKEKIKTATLSFPQYGQKSAGLVEEYLNGKYGGKPELVSPYTASLLYALDRFDASFKIRAWLAAGKTVILDRYVDSNAGHQGGKIRDPRERKKFLRWLYAMEYEVLAVPKPDVVLILHVPAHLNQKLVDQKKSRTYIKKGKRDIHEADLQHLRDAENSYLFLATEYPENHILIECMDHDRLMSREEVHEMIWKALTTVLSFRT